MPRPNLGDRIKMVGTMPEDPDPIAVGDEGTVDYVSHEFGQYGVAWDSGRSLMVLANDPFVILRTNARRHAVVRGQHDRLESIRRYLPSNYVADSDGADVYIHGVDRAGWTLDGYVIPRLASGLYRAEEMS